MTDTTYEGLLRDIIMEINELAIRDDIWEDTDFDRGYRAGMAVIMQAIEDEIKAFHLPKNEKPLQLIDVGKWFREGPNYRP